MIRKYRYESRSEDYVTVDPKFGGLGFFSFVRGNPTLEIYKGERPPFPYKRGYLPFDFRKRKRETMSLLQQKKCEILMTLN